MPDQDLTVHLQNQVQQALAAKTPLRIVGGNSKAFYGLPTSASMTLELSGHSGVIAYEPSELVITVRAGMPLQDISSVLAEQGQMLAFEPPVFSPQSTIGGTIACGFSGPRRPYAGSARDFVLGCRILNGHAEILQFGGQVMKNVAGFDVSRLMAGALGQLGVLLDISLRVLPVPDEELSLTYPVADADSALALMQHWQTKPWPISALAYHDKLLWLRLSGAKAATQTAASALSGNLALDGNRFWQALRDQQLEFFQHHENLWRISLAPATPMLDIQGNWLIDWGGAQRWLVSSEPAESIHAKTIAQGGHATCFRGNIHQDWVKFEPGVLALHNAIRQAFDPHQLFNPQRFSAEL